MDSFYTMHWILNHEGATVTVISYHTETDGTLDVSTTPIHGRVDDGWSIDGKPRLIFDDPNDNFGYLKLIIEPDHNTLTNDWEPSDQSGGQLTRDAA